VPESPRLEGAIVRELLNVDRRLGVVVWDLRWAKPRSRRADFRKTAIRRPRPKVVRS
jgi:hypothetical protein